MKNKTIKRLGVSLLSLGILTACGDSGETAEQAGEGETKQEEEQKSEHPVDEGKVKPSEQLIKMTYNQGQFTEKEKKSFIEKHVNSDAKEIISMTLMIGGEKSKQYSDIKAVAQAEITSEGQTMDMVKVQAKNADNKTVDLYVMYIKDKIGYFPINADKLLSQDPSESSNEMMSEESMKEFQSFIRKVEDKLE